MAIMSPERTFSRPELVAAKGAWWTLADSHWIEIRAASLLHDDPF